MRLVLLGDEADIANVDLAGWKCVHNCYPQPSDSVLIVVSAQNGPMPSFTRTLNLATGAEVPRVAILITDASRAHEEMDTLVEYEIRGLLEAMNVFGTGYAARMACFRTEGSRLSDEVLAWESAAPETIRFAKAELLPDW
jgi:translation elongation factor EF-Tu-like GTPase